MKTNPLAPICALSDSDLLARVKELTRREQQATAELVAHLGEVDGRRLYLGQGCSSLFTYCTQVLGYSEHEAYGRIEAARAARKFPFVLEVLGEGAVHLTAVGLLAPHLTKENHRALLGEARYKSKREVERIVARLRPQPDARSLVRKLPEPTPPPAPPALLGAQDTPAPGSPAASVPTAAAPPLSPAPPMPPRPAVVAPLSPQRFKIQLTASADTHDKLRRVQDLMRHELPTGDIAVIFDRALTVLLADLEKKKLAATLRPREGRPAAPGSRHIPAAVKRAVWARDGGRCTFVSPEGRRCTETGMLQWDHAHPHALGGEATVEGIRLRCAAHNHYTAELLFGPPPLCAREPRLSYDPRGSSPAPSPTCLSTRSGPSPCQLPGPGVRDLGQGMMPSAP
jgi:hypothetical protein